MRVIAGKARSLPLKTVASDKTRPTTDRIKETLFNMLNPYLYGVRFLDLFAGSGAIGIEALSRGAKEAVFVDSEREAFRVITENLFFTKLDGQARVLLQDAVSAVRRLSAEKQEPFGIVFMDPPYRMGLEKEVLSVLLNSGLVNEDSLILFEAAIETDISFVTSLGYTVFKQKKYKSNQHVWLKIGHKET